MKNFNKEKLLEIFEELLMIHSPSYKEENVAKYIIDFVKELGGEIYLDKSYDKYGGNAPTIFTHFKGEGEGVTFSSHMDVIEPNKDLKIIKDDKIWKTDGNTTLGGDDKGGVAAILYAIYHIITNNIKHRDIYAIFTPGEEVGMLGARNINWDEVYKNMNPAKNMIVVDNAGSCDKVAYKAPTSYSFTFKIRGKSAHAGIEPEKGISAIILAAKALSQFRTLRIDEFTTSNISKISSDFPSNVVPDYVEFSGEIRGHDEDHVFEILDEYENIVKNLTENYEFEKTLDYPALRPTDMSFSKEILNSYKNVGVDAKEVVIGGGSDANFFAEEGFNSLIVGVGMEKVHTKEEYIVLDDLFKTTMALIDYLEV
ncbi:M20/M25/M40 family metallo-hydrolase [Peptoniphilus sp. MSJ-1]|uniref:M20/M25/M40 family metallo-hydrolase n=1 Tax=Peptoniphilus ovalis TaxID=2841503 RepID=A0ABS6FG78_9FIRM|nr:M20/M25/M40 family metallo-hydrolase [Peptoniphilus ovalis]MBU5668235.1 M20/M25/M40 family metallo-hydrolase [Peptoniphilus ovalis]